MTRAFGASDAEGGWVWKDAYEAAEAAVVIFMQRYGRGMRRNAGAGGPRRMLAMLEAVAALEPSHTRRSEEQVRLQQFSTPLPLAYAALQAAAIRPGDVVLEPSAGTGMLAVMAQCALGNAAPGNLHLNEYARVRARLLTLLFPEAVVTAFNAEAIADRLRDVRPTVVLMNPPFSATPGVDRIARDAEPPPRPLGRLDAAAGRPAGDDHVGPLHARRHRRPARSAGTLPLHHGHRRPRLRKAGHRFRHPPHRAGARRRTRGRRPAPGRVPGWTGQRAPRTPPSCWMRLFLGCRLGRPSRRRRPRPAPPATCSASRWRRSRRSGVPSPRRRPRPAGPMTGGRLRSWSSSSARSIPPIQAPTPPLSPAPTPPGGRASCGCPARSNIRRRWCSPPPWRPCRIPRRLIVRCSRSA